MIVCICAATSHHTVNAAIDAGARTVDQLSRDCAGAGNHCGTCRPTLRCMIAERSGCSEAENAPAGFDAPAEAGTLLATAV